jgi:hypothetical protein
MRHKRLLIVLLCLLFLFSLLACEISGRVIITVVPPPYEPPHPPPNPSQPPPPHPTRPAPPHPGP